MKKRIILFALVLAIFSVMVAGCNYMSNAWSCTGLSNNLNNDSWVLKANSVNGHGIGKIVLTSDTLATVHIDSTNSDGTVSLIISQGDTERTVDINKNFSGNIDMSGFTAGRINFRLDFANAKDVNFSMNW